jgi:hypothetical protein
MLTDPVAVAELASCVARRLVAAPNAHTAHAALATTATCQPFAPRARSSLSVSPAIELGLLIVDLSRPYRLDRDRTTARGSRSSVLSVAERGSALV